MKTKKARRITYTRPPLKKYQLDAFFHSKRYAWIEGTTKCGKTHTGIVWLHEEALTGSFKNYWWVAPSYKTAKIAYSRMAAAIPKQYRKLNETDLTITLVNGHIIWFLSGEKPDNLYGEDVGAVVIDEASRMREEAWAAIRSVVTFTAGKVRAIGNVKGKKNWFYRLCREAEKALDSSTPTNDHYAKITAADAVRVGILPQAEIDDARTKLPEAVFNELYYAIPTEDGSNPFGLTHIAACVRPLSLANPVCHGIDLAKSVDWTVVIGLDAKATVSAFDRFQKPWEEAYKSIYTITDASRAPSLVDSTGVGDPVLERLQKDRPGARFEGYKFTSESKQKLMEGLAVAIQSRRVFFPDGPIRSELEQFEFEYTRTGVRYSAPEGVHDDCVVALALAVSIFVGKASKFPASRWGGTTTASEPEWA